MVKALLDIPAPIYMTLFTRRLQGQENPAAEIDEEEGDKSLQCSTFLLYIPPTM